MTDRFDKPHGLRVGHRVKVKNQYTFGGYTGTVITIYPSKQPQLSSILVEFDRPYPLCSITDEDAKSSIYLPEELSY